MRITVFAPTIPPVAKQTAASPVPISGYGPPATATSWKTGRFSGPDFPLKPDGTLQCPAGHALSAQGRRREADGSLRVVYAASIRSCRPCPLREQCQWNGSVTAKPRQVSVLLHPLAVGSAPLLWRDWSRRSYRRACRQLLRHQCSEVRVRPRSHACDPPFPGRTCPYSALVGTAADSQCTPQNCWSGDDQTVRRPRRLCHLARLGDDLNAYDGLPTSVPSPGNGLLLRVEPRDLFSNVFSTPFPLIFCPCARSLQRLLLCIHRSHTQKKESLRSCWGSDTWGCRLAGSSRFLTFPASSLLNGGSLLLTSISRKRKNLHDVDHFCNCPHPCHCFACMGDLL